VKILGASVPLDRLSESGLSLAATSPAIHDLPTALDSPQYPGWLMWQKISG